MLLSHPILSTVYMNEKKKNAMNTKAKSLYRQEGKRDHEHIQRETVNTKIVQPPGCISNRREKIVRTQT
jgi:hypothetical protein